MNPKSIDLIELIEANPFTPTVVIIADFLGIDDVTELFEFLRKSKQYNRDDIIQILNQSGFDDLL